MAVRLHVQLSNGEKFRLSKVDDFELNALNFADTEWLQFFDDVSGEILVVRTIAVSSIYLEKKLGLIDRLIEVGKVEEVAV